jgi:hypothetical protein
VRPADVSPRAWSRWLKAREEAPLFADDPSVVPPPPTVDQELARRRELAEEFGRRMAAIDREMRRRVRRLHRILRRAGVTMEEIRNEARAVRGLGPAYLADALRRSVRRRGLDDADG